MAAHTFSAVLEDAGDGWVYAHVPELPEVQTQGESLDQAREISMSCGRTLRGASAQPSRVTARSRRRPPVESAGS